MIIVFMMSQLSWRWGSWKCICWQTCMLIIKAVNSSSNNILLAWLLVLFISFSVTRLRLFLSNSGNPGLVFVKPCTPFTHCFKLHIKKRRGLLLCMCEHVQSNVVLQVGTSCLGKTVQWIGIVTWFKNTAIEDSLSFKLFYGVLCNSLNQ